MTNLEKTLTTVPVPGVAEPHQSTVAAILRAVRLGMFSADEAELMIGRVRALATRYAAGTPPISPDRTVM